MNTVDCLHGILLIFQNVFIEFVYKEIYSFLSLNVDLEHETIKYDNLLLSQYECEFASATILFIVTLSVIIMVSFYMALL